MSVKRERAKKCICCDSPASEYGLWCKDCWQDRYEVAAAELQHAVICQDCGRPALPGQAFCQVCMDFYTASRS